MNNASINNASYRAGTLVYTKRTLAALFSWLLWGDVCFMLMEGAVPSILPLRFEKLGASNTTIGLSPRNFPRKKFRRRRFPRRRDRDLLTQETFVK